uniref:Uncharacterized protein n=1 Tax=viral metagenome TaxID=1070528 RepID=A0A6M3IKA6_9ZZZZ
MKLKDFIEKTKGMNPELELVYIDDFPSINKISDVEQMTNDEIGDPDFDLDEAIVLT